MKIDNTARSKYFKKALDNLSEKTENKIREYTKYLKKEKRMKKIKEIFELIIGFLLLATMFTACTLWLSSL